MFLFYFCFTLLQRRGGTDQSFIHDINIYTVPGWCAQKYLNLDHKPDVMTAKNSLVNRTDLKEFRKYLRNNSTLAEIAMWKILKNKSIDGRKFRRQYSIGIYIVDFCCPTEKLVIELDGNAHAGYHKILKDIERDK
jgi:hypothetical protein